jgi:hypothetical protein
MGQRRQPHFAVIGMRSRTDRAMVDL